MAFLSYIYYIITSIRNLLYDKKIFKIREIPNVEIICIGNITVGGTGKTPAVQFFAKKFLKMNRKVAIVSRGYKGKRKVDPLIVSDGKQIYASVVESGDEPYLHAINLKIPVVVGRDRYEACVLAVKTFGVDTIILDDGFQHRKLKRDRDVILIDATNPFGWNALLPKGTLREDFKKAANRASEFIITKSDLVSENELDKLKRYLKLTFNKEVSVAKYGVTSLCDIEGNAKPLFWVNKKRILLFSGLANPFNFEKTAISLNPEYIERIDFLDHHSFKEKDFINIKNRAKEMSADYIITTEKDFVKLPKDINIKKLFTLKVEFIMIEDNSVKGFGEKDE